MNIFKHNKFAICSNCNSIAHEKCAQKTFKFDQIHETWRCWQCNLNQVNRYNPFNKLYRDKHLPDDSNATDEIDSISQILNSCKSYTLKDIDSLTNEIEAKFPIIFNNINGAASNFDSFTTELGLCRTEFSIIGIAETNLDEEHGKLYNLPGYKPEFQSKFYGKTKGSGLAIFLKDNLIYSLCNT